MIPGIAFLIGLAVAMLLAYRSGSPGLVRSGLAMAGNLALVWLGTSALGSYAPWSWFIAIDVATAFVVLSHPASRPQAIIGAIYLLQIVVHVAFGAAGSAEHVRLYLDLLAFGGACQLLTLATGAIHGRRRKMGRAWAVGGGHPRVARAHLASVEERP